MNQLVAHQSGHQLNSANGYQIFLNLLASSGIHCFSGVTGGGVVNLLKYIQPIVSETATDEGFLTLGEYCAGFVPLGYFLASGKIAGAVATTGAATKLLSCGLSDAKLHDIPAVYIVPLSNSHTLGLAPLQDTSQHGSHIQYQLEAELPEGVFVLDDPEYLGQQLIKARLQLQQSKPVVFLLINDRLSEHAAWQAFLPDTPPEKITPPNSFLQTFRRAVEGRRLVVLVGEEMARYPSAKALTTKLAHHFKSALIWTINGANAVSRENTYGYGYIAFGGNCCAIELYQSLGQDDVLLVLGACPDEYTVNLQSFTAAHTFYVSGITHGYGGSREIYQHQASGHYEAVTISPGFLLEALLDESARQPFHPLPCAPAPRNLNKRSFSLPAPGYVDMAVLYQCLDNWWPAGSIGFDDVCLAYKDRQFVVQRPNDNIQFYSLYRGSAMGGAFGAAVGARLAESEMPVFLFTGDGCFRLFSGSLAEARSLGLVIFLLNNESFGIVEQGLEKVLPDTPSERFHAHVHAVDYVAIAQANGWDAVSLSPDLSNLGSILTSITPTMQRSLLIEVRCDVNQQLGHNPRVKNL